MIMLKTLALKYGLYAIALVVLAIVAKNWLNHHDQKVIEAARITVTQEITKQKEKEWQAKRKEIDLAIQTAALDRKQAQADRQLATNARIALAQDRARMETSYKIKLEQLEQQRRSNLEIINNIPAAMLDAHIRAKSGDLKRSGPAER